MKNQKNYLLFSIMAFLIILIALVITLRVLQKEEAEENYNIQIENGIIVTDADYDAIKKESMQDKLLGMGERDRMEYYISNFVNLVEKDKIEEAYALLNAEFKENYFPTAGQFQTYVEKYFYSMSSLNFTNIERTGNVYIMWVNIKDLINGKPSDPGKECTFVIKENNVNDIELSFNVEGIE